MKSTLALTTLLLFAITMLASCTSVSPVDIAFAEVSLKTHGAVTPKPQTAKWAQKWWMPRHEAIKKRVSQGNVDIVMIGDSITHAMERHKDLWAKHYASRNTVNMGFSGDYTEHVLWRLENGELDGISPKLAIVMIGTNNSNRKDYTAEEIADGIIAVCAKIRGKTPQTKILLLAIFPRGKSPNKQREKVAKASLLASRVADGKMIHYLDIGSAFLSRDGSISKDVMYDYLHLSKKGAYIWVNAMEAKVAELSGRSITSVGK